MLSSLIKAAFRKGNFYRTVSSKRTTFSSSATTAEVDSNKGEADISKLSVRLSDQCVQKLKKIATDGSFLRIIVEGGGCSGFQYKFDLDTVMNEDDNAFERDGVKVVIDSISLPFLAGSTVDYREELIRSAFRIIHNPQAESRCSCGTSFSVKT